MRTLIAATVRARWPALLVGLLSGALGMIAGWQRLAWTRAAVGMVIYFLACFGLAMWFEHRSRGEPESCKSAPPDVR